MAAKVKKKSAAVKKNAPDKSGKKESNMFREIVLEILLPAFILFLFIHFFVAEARFVPSPSMVPTIEEGDRFMVEKVSYYFRTPARGEIIVFHPPAEALEKARAINQQDAVRLNDFIKRVIGLPGETVAVRNGQVYINGKLLPEPYIEPSRRANYEFGPVTVDKGSYLVLGDNRQHSWDGHVWGFVPKKNIVGHAVWRFWPLNRMGNLK